MPENIPQNNLAPELSSEATLKNSSGNSGQSSISSGGPSFALLAYGSWGLVPIYWKLVGVVPAGQMVAHRIIWSLLTVSFFFLRRAARQELLAVLLSPRRLLWMFGSALFLSSNWLIFVWAVQQKLLLQVSLGYFINPLVNVLLGALLLKEHLSRLQKIAFVVACAGVCVYSWGLNSFPLISLMLALTFGIYGLMRKKAPVEPMVGLAVESILLLPIACAFLFWQYHCGLLVFDGTVPLARGLGAGLTTAWATQETNLTPGAQLPLWFLILCAGPITSFPLLWFAHAARRLKLSTLGFFQYLAPSMQFALAVFLYREQFSMTHLMAFVCIWAAIAVYVLDSLLRARRALA